MSGPVALYNFGSVCYLNSGIQAISSCSRFAFEMNELSKKWNHLKKLNMFNRLMKMMKSQGSFANISNNNIFREWTKPGQQDSYELLAHVINQVLDEIRKYLEESDGIKKGNLREWLAVKLPLRMTMEYNIKCSCGKTEVSPTQSEIALHISFKDLHIEKKLSLVDMLDSHFDADEILDYDCADARCTLKSGSRRLKLFSPLPETLCIHLQRLFWDGSRMKKIDKEVSFSNRITMKKDYSKVTGAEEQAEDCHYYLRSVIVHHGTESCGHYICHTKRNNRWYYTSDSSVRRERAVEVFRSNPYILFYERSEVDEVSPRTVKYSDCINLFVHAVAACPSFVTWLNAWVHVPSARGLRDLLDLANGNIGDDEVSEGWMIKEWIDIRDIRELIITVLPRIHSDVSKYGGTPMEVDGGPGTLTSEFPSGVEVIQESKCGCGRILDQSILIEVAIDIQCMLKYPGSIQNILDDHFKEHVLDRPSCQGPKCNGSDCVYKVTLKGPLPEVICVKVSILDYGGRLIEWFNSGVKIDNDITIRRGYFEDKTYYLKSVIYNNYCLRNVSGSWYRIDMHDVAIVDNRESWKKGPCILFYEALPVEERPNSPECTPEDVDPNDYHLSIRRGPNEVPIRMIEKAHGLNMFIHTIGSCPRFLNWLKDVNIGGGVQSAKDLTDLINLVNRRIERDTRLERLITSNTSSNYVYTTMMDGLCKLNADVMEWSQYQPPKVSYGGVEYPILSPMVVPVCRILKCECGNVEVHPPSMEMIYDISFRVPDDHTGIETMQEVFDRHFEVKYINGPCSPGRCTGTRQSIEVKLGPYLPEILCVKLTLRYGEGHTEECCDKRVKMDDNIVIGSIFQRTSDSSHKEYSLKAFVDKDYCHRCVGGVWYRIGRQSIEVDRDEHLMEGDVGMLIYEAYQTPSEKIFSPSQPIQHSDRNNSDTETLTPKRVNDQTPSDNIISSHPQSQPRESNISDTDTLTPKMVNEHKPLNSIVHALSSCSLFLDKLRRVRDDPSSSLGLLCYLTDVANGRIERDTSDERRWHLGSGINDVYEQMRIILKGVDQIKYSDLGIAAVNFDLSFPTSLSSGIFFNIDYSQSVPGRTLQQLLEEHLLLQFDLSRRTLSFLLKSNDILKKVDLPDTLCFRLPRLLYRDIDVVEEVIFSNMSCLRQLEPDSHQRGSLITEKLGLGSCIIKYGLRAFIDKDDVCYRSLNGRWMRIDGPDISLARDSVFKEVRPQMIFYEIHSNQ